MTREEQIRSKAKELGQKYFPDEANVWARGNIKAEDAPLQERFNDNKE